MLQNSKLMGVVGSGIKNGVKSTKSVSQVSERQDVKPLEEMKATDCGVLISNVIKTQNTEKYEKIYNDLDKESKDKFDGLSQKDKDVISTIFKMNLDLDTPMLSPDLLPPSIPSPPPLPPLPPPPFPSFSPIASSQGSSFDKNSSDDASQNLSFDRKNSEVKNTILKNLIEIFTNDAYSDLKSYYRKNVNDNYLDIDILNNYQVCDISNYLSKTNLSVEDFFENDDNFKNIMLEIKKNNFENEEIKNEVKENLYELANNEKLKIVSLSQKDVASIIKFLKDENKKMGKFEIREKRSILDQLKIFGNYNLNCSGYNVKDKLDVFNTFVDLIPENESFLDYKDKIIDCVNNSVKYSYNARNFLKVVLKPNIETIKEKDYKTLLDRMIKCPYPGFKDDLYCNVIFDKENKYKNASPVILNIILQKAFDIQHFDSFYGFYLPILQKADEMTLSNMTGDMLYDLVEFLNFLNIIQVNEEEYISLESLSFQQLKELQVFLKKNPNISSFENMNMNFLNKNFEKIFIKNDNKIDYAYTLSEVNKLLSGKHLDLPQIQKDNINNILKVKDDLAKINFEEIKIYKTNKFENLKSNFENILENDNSICDSDKKNILARLTNDIGSLMFNELPQNLNKFEVVEEIKNELNKYFTFNKVQNEENAYTIGDVKISGMDDKTKSTLEFIFKAIPELVVLLGVNQGYRFDIGKHILAVGKEVVKNDKFQTLSQNNQKLVLIAALMHDIAKMDGGHDASHPQKGSHYAYNMLNGVLSDDDKATVANLILNHHFGESIANDEDDNEKMYTLAYECKDENPEFLNMLEILDKADLLGDAESYKKMTKDYLEQIPGRIETLKQNIQTINGILGRLKDTLELTPFPQKTLALAQDNETAMQECKKLGIVGEFKSKDITIDKIDLAKMKNLSPEEQEKYLSLLGFHNTQYNQLEFLIHAINEGIHVSGIDNLTSQFKSNATLSTSIITMANTVTYNSRKYGFIMEPDKTKVLSAATSNIASGCDKGRNVSGKYISQSEYSDYNKLSKYIKDSRLRAQNGHSELITIDNEVAAIFVKKGCEKDIPKELVEFAHKRNLPLIVVPRPKFEDEEET